MSEELVILPASSFALDALAEIFTRSFEAYFYPGTVSSEQLAARVRTENLDLHRSLVMLLDDQGAGVALLGLRGERAWCGGFGLLPSLRGRGLAHQLAAAMLDQARQAGARSLGLEVLARNAPAIRTYTRAGFHVRRDLLILEWRRPHARPEPQAGRAGPALAVVDGEPARLIERFAALHPVPPAWQRDLPALLVRGGAQGLAILEADRVAAYALTLSAPDGSARIADIGAERAQQVSALLAAIQERSTPIISINEPADSPFIPAFFSAGFAEIDRQHEMEISL